VVTYRLLYSVNTYLFSQPDRQDLRLWAFLRRLPSDSTDKTQTGPLQLSLRSVNNNNYISTDANFHTNSVN